MLNNAEKREILFSNFQIECLTLGYSLLVVAFFSLGLRILYYTIIRDKIQCAESLDLKLLLTVPIGIVTILIRIGFIYKSIVLNSFFVIFFKQSVFLL